MPRRPTLATLAAALIAPLAALPAAAQDYGAMLQQQMAAMNANIARGQQMVDAAVRQRMADPQVQAGYRRHVAQMQAQGRAPMDYPTYTYNWIYTNGYSAAGIAHARANEAGIAQAEHAKLRELRAAEAARGAAQQQHREHVARNQQEAGRGLLGQGSWLAPDGSALALPHTWQPDSQHVFLGRTYRVDASGQYHVLATDGWWHPLRPRPAGR